MHIGKHKLLLSLVLLAFGLQGLYILYKIGYWSIWLNNLNHLAGQQALADLLIALSLVMIWLVRDAKATGRKAWPWIALTLAAGSFGPLIYLLTANPKAKV